MVDAARDAPRDIVRPQTATEAATEPVWQAQTAPVAVARRVPYTIPLLGIPLPGLMNDIIDDAANTAYAGRVATLRAMPVSIVNNSSNFIGITHLAGDMMMLKANGTKMLKPKQIKSSLDYIRVPFLNTLETARFGFSVKDLARPGFYVESLTSLTSFDAAARADLVRGNGALFNRWQARSTLCGLTGMAVNALLPDDVDDQPEVEQMAKLYSKQPLRYYGRRLEQALNPFEWPTHKRQFTGMAITLAGASSFISGFRNVSELPRADALAKNMKYTYRLNPAHAAGGLITLLGGAQLWAGIDDEQGWKDFGRTMTLRTLFLFHSISNRFDPKHLDPGRHWYAGGQALFTAKDVGSYFIGGAEKRPDGTLIDKQHIREAALRRAAAGELSGPAPEARLQSPADHKGMMQAEGRQREAP